MPTFDAEGARAAGYTDAEIQGAQKALAAGYTPEEISAHLSGQVPQQPQPAPQGFMANAADFVKSIPDAAAKSFYQSGAGLRGEGEFLTSPFNGGVTTPPQMDIPTGLPTPQGKAGEYGAAVGSALGNPASFTGPGSAALKAMGAILSGIGSKAGEDTGIPGGGLVGGLVGGGIAAKGLGTRPVEAATPSLPELKASYKGRYGAANATGLEVSPGLLKAYGHFADQQLGRFDPALPAVKYIREMRDHAGGGIVTADNLDTVRQRLGEYARETSEGKPTSNAAAATIALQIYNKVLDNIPPSAVKAGDPAAYIRETRLGNQDYMAAQQLRDAQKRINAAEVDTGRGFATKIDNQLKAKFAPILKNESQQRGLSPEQIGAVQKLNDASPIAKQFGRFTPFSPVGLGLHALAAPLAAVTGGASAIPQIMLAGAAHGGRMVAEHTAKKLAKQIADLAAQRSALYQQRLNALPPPQSLAGNPAQLIRGGILGLQ